MLEDDLTYYRRRAETELERAQRAEDPSVVKAHYELASAYLDRLARSDEADLHAGGLALPEASARALA